jgi:hypothetical protein
LEPIFEYQGIQFSNIARMMSEEERRSSFASTMMAPINTEVDNQVVGSGRPQGLEVAALGPGGIEEPPRPSLERYLGSSNNM